MGKGNFTLPSRRSPILPTTKIVPSEELIQKVAFIVWIKSMLPSAVRDKLDVGGIHYKAYTLSGGKTLYQATGTLIPKLGFTVVPDGPIIVHKYNPGDWESAVTTSYKAARMYYANILLDQLEQMEIPQLLEAISDWEETARSLEDYRDLIGWWYLVGLYEKAARFQDMECAAKKCIELSPDDGQCYFTLGKIYLAALSNFKTGQLTEAFRLKNSGLTPESLGYSAEQVQHLAKETLEQALLKTKMSRPDENLEQFDRLLLEKHLESIKEKLDYLDKL
jgi:hypothetical protein